MGFQYHKSKKKVDESTQWSSYSDLFMMLAVVFLLMYVTSSVREGAFSIQKYQEYQRLAKEAESLKDQLRVYNTLKDDYLEKKASQDEVETYEELMAKLDLLQNENKDEARKLEQKAQENKAKATALNKYQQIIRNIINNNVIARARVDKKNEIITQKNEEIELKEADIDDQLIAISKLERNVKQKEQQIEQNKRQIAKVQSQRDQQIQKINKMFQQQRITKSRMREQIAKLKQDANQQIQQLESKAQQTQSELKQVSRQLANVNTELMQAKDTIEEESKKNEQLAEELASAADRAKEQMETLQAEFDVKRRLDKQKFEKALKREKLSKAQIKKRQQEFQKQAKQKEKELAKKLAGLNTKVETTEKELKKARELLKAREKLAKQIIKNFKKEGIKAGVDEKTGDVLLTFGDQYFDTGRASLKGGMIEKLKKFIPIYAKSLMEDPKTAEKIDSVEIVGFASPTFKGKYVDPRSMDEETKTAVNYNLQLSFDRAKSIFNYMFDKSKMDYRYQGDLRPLVKVTGRSFLAEDIEGRSIASSLSRKEYCEKFDCKKSQRVIIKFSLKD